MRRWDGRKIEEVGNAQGLVAIFCDEGEAIDIAELHSPNDGFRHEIMEAVERAYPKDEA